jgi:iron complex outermembrane receptor protein
MTTWLALWAFTGFGTEPSTNSPILANLTFEQLSQITITTASQRPEVLARTPAAVTVLTGNDLQRSGVVSIPEALRLVPGMDIGRINSSRYAVTARGFSDEFANKLLVLMDGRSVYTPQFSGVFWDTQDLVMEDVDRIEVVRGPGGTAWGANAFNGVVNVVSKSARDTQGGMVSASGGTFDQSAVAVRYGGKINDHTWYRVFAKGSRHDETFSASGQGLGDDWNSTLGGFRVDSEVSEENRYMVQGGVTHVAPLQYSQGNPDRFMSLGGYLQGKWNHSFSESSELETQVYYDALRRDTVQNTVNTDTLDFEARHRLEWGERNLFHWGLNYRYINSRPSSTPQHEFIPAEQSIHQAGMFIEDEYSFIPKTLQLSLGCKLEYYSLAGWEPLPNARLSWTPEKNHTFWASIARGVRTPSTDGRYLNINTPSLVGLPKATGETEKLIAYEAGYRAIVGERLNLDLTGFIHTYSDLGVTKQIGGPVPVVVQSVNEGGGHAWGVEPGVTWQSTDWWRWRATYSFIEMSLVDHSPAYAAAALRRTETIVPSHQASLWWSFQPHKNVDLDSILRYVDERRARNIPQYLTFDLRVAWRLTSSLELAVAGQNLLDSHHQEYTASPGFPTISEVPRSVYAKLTWKF